MGERHGNKMSVESTTDKVGGMRDEGSSVGRRDVRTRWTTKQWRSIGYRTKHTRMGIKVGEDTD